MHQNGRYATLRHDHLHRNCSADETSFHVKIGGSEDNRQTILGFDTESDADAWIVNDKRLTDDTALFVIPPGS